MRTRRGRPGAGNHTSADEQIQIAIAVNVGHRDIFLLPKDVKRTFVETHPAEAIAADLGQVAASLRKRVSKAKRVWIDLDVDAIDPAYAPAVPQPSPFGLTPMQLLALLDAAWSDKLVGFSVSEFDPGRDTRDQTLHLLGWLVEFLLLKRYEGAGGGGKRRRKA